MKGRRRGVFILELTVATIILVALMSVFLKWVVATAGQRRAADRRQAALREAANTLERLAASPWGELTPERTAKQAMSEPSRRALPGGELAAQVTQPAGELDTKLLAVTVRWRPHPETPPEQVRLVAWKFRGSVGREKEKEGEKGKKEGSVKR